MLLKSDLPHPERSCRETNGGEAAVVGHGVDREDVPVSSPVEAEYDDVTASSRDGLPFRKSLTAARRGFLKRAEPTAEFFHISRKRRGERTVLSRPTCRALAGLGSPR